MELRGALPRSPHASHRDHANNKKTSKNEITDERIPEKHPGRRRAVLRQPYRQRLNKAGKILHVTGVVNPRYGIRDYVKDERRCDRSGEERFPRRAALQKQPQAADNRKTKVVREDEWTNE